MNDQLKKCVEQIRVAFNASPNARRPPQRRKPVKEAQTLGQLKKGDYTGFYGLWSPRSKRFVFGIQEDTRTAAGEQAKKRLGKRWKYDFEVRKIRYRNASDFNDGLRRKDNES